MRRFYAHYILLYPAAFLKNYVIELDENNCLIAYYSFQEELRYTEFYSGLLVFSSENDQPDWSFITDCWNRKDLESLSSLVHGNNLDLISTKDSLKMAHFL